MIFPIIRLVTLINYHTGLTCSKLDTSPLIQNFSFEIVIRISLFVFFCFFRNMVSIFFILNLVYRVKIKTIMNSMLNVIIRWVVFRKRLNNYDKNRNIFIYFHVHIKQSMSLVCLVAFSFKSSFD